MPPDLSSANWKIDRAVELLGELDREVLAWFDTKPCGFYVYINPEFTRVSVIVKGSSDPPIIRWSLIIADILHNLRCALDHAFWALLQSEFPSGIPAKVDKLSFPIWDAPPNADQRRNFNTVSNKLFAAVEAVQPYNNPTAQFPVHPLAIIRDIDNGNKHKLLFTVMHSVARIHVAVTGLRKQYEDGVAQSLHRGEIKDGVEAVVLTFDVPHPYMKCECDEFMSIIAIKHPVANRLGQDRDDYAALIDALIAQVRETISSLISATI
jgi:hypothetical protein